jgi:hypothetical protein
MPNGPLDFWESLSVNELIAWAFVFGCFVLFVHLLKRADEARNPARTRRGCAGVVERHVTCSTVWL